MLVVGDNGPAEEGVVRLYATFVTDISNFSLLSVFT